MIEYLNNTQKYQNYVYLITSIFKVMKAVIKSTIYFKRKYLVTKFSVL
jgi:hypothetical protein